MILRWLILWSRGLRSEPGRSLGVAALVLVTVLIAASVPLVLGRASDSALRQEVSAAPSTVRNLELVQDGRIEVGDSDPLQYVEAAGVGLASRFPDPLPSVMTGQELVVDTPLWHPSAGTPLDSVLNLRIQQDVDSHLRLVAGRLPTGASTTIQDPTPGADKDSRLVVLEVAAASETAQRLGVPIGGRLILGPEPSDALAANRSIRLAVDLVGTYDVVDPTNPFWMDDASVAHSYTYALQQFVEYAGGTLLLAPEAYPALMEATQSADLPMIYRWRSYIAPDAIESSQIDALSDALRRAETAYPPAVPTLASNGQFNGSDHMSPASLQTGLLRLLTIHQARWQSGATILTILWTGAGLVIIASLALVAEMVARRRRSALAIVGRRGASVRQLWGAVISESLILVLPAGIVAAILAILLLPVPDPTTAVLVAVTVVLVAIVLVALASRPTRGDGRADQASAIRRTGNGRLVAEALVVGLAVVGAVLLRDRGAAAGSGRVAVSPTQGAETGADPFLALAPALVGLAAGIIAVRLLPVVLRLFVRILARGRGLVPVLGLQRAARGGSVAAVLVVALTATSVGAFASALLDEIDSGATSASWQTVGADFQVTSSAANLVAFQAKHLAGVEAEAAIAVESVSISTGGSRELIVVDPAAASAVGAGTPADPLFPAAMLQPTDGPIPAIVSSSDPETGPVSLGQSFSVRIAGTAVTIQAAAIRAEYPSIAAATPFVVVSSAQLAAIAPALVPMPTAVLVRAPTLSVAQIQASVAGMLGVTVQGQAATEGDVRDAPAVTAVSLGILSGAIAVFAYGLLTIVLAIALDTADRRRETARLQILGLSRRQAVTLVAVEFAPAVIVGVLAGLALGLGLIEFVGPGLGLPAVLGVGALQPSMPDVGRLLLLAVAILAAITVATLLSTVLERQMQLSTAVRD